jgi:hypothetical protein
MHSEVSGDIRQREELLLGKVLGRVERKIIRRKSRVARSSFRVPLVLEPSRVKPSRSTTKSVNCGQK